jgi:hypothetical protein
MMRFALVLLASTALSACGGAGLQTAGSSAATPTGTTGTSGTTGTTAASAHTFVNPTESKTYNGIGAVQSYTYTTDNIDQDPGTAGIQSAGQGGQLYSGDATTARNSGISITYNPRDAIFDLVIKQPLANIDQTTRYQDPAHRTAFGGDSAPYAGTPDFTSYGVKYLQNGSATGTLRFSPDNSSSFPDLADGGSYTNNVFFYQTPGTLTKYVTFAGFIRTSLAITEVIDPVTALKNLSYAHTFNRAAFAYGERSANSVVPKTGTGTFAGNFIATTVFNNLLDTDRSTPTFLQWIGGTSAVGVNFAANSFTLGLSGTVTAPLFDAASRRIYSLQSGAAFAANGAGQLDLVNADGFRGAFTTAYFTNPDGTRLNVNIGGSSIDGSFFGPAAQEVGGGFRIVGGTPDERVDILGAFTGK